MPLTRNLTQPLTRAITRSITQAGAGGGFSSVSVFVGGHEGVLYYYNDPAKLTGVVNPTDLITSAIDQSGNGHDLAQAGAIRPAWNNGRAEFASGDFMKATGIDYSGADVLTTIAALYKPTAAGVRYISEHGSNAGTEPGATLTASPFDGAQGFGVTSRGSALASALNSNSPTPLYAVVTGITRVSTDTCVLRVNGVLEQVSISNQGTGNYQNADLYIGAGGDGTTHWFPQLNLYAYLQIAKELTEDDLNNVEKEFAALLSGVTIGTAKFTLLAIGDSLTYAINGGVTAPQAYVKQLDTRLSRVVWSVNEGISGNSTCNMMARRWQMIRQATPNICIIYGGTNDVTTVGTVAASPTPTSTVFTITPAFGAYYEADGWITVGGESAQILSVASSAITLKAPLSGGAPAAGTAIAIDTQKNLTELANYVKNAGCKRVMILGMHYFNFNNANADTVAVEVARNAAIRTKQRAAATATGAVYVDLYAWMSALITAGTYTQGDNGWHSAANDQHLNLAGQTILADAIEAAIIAQGWT